MKVTRCINCNQLPEIVEDPDSGYQYTLRHKEGDVCYPRFKLESHQNTKKECAEDWNEFNQRS